MNKLQQDYIKKVTSPFLFRIMMWLRLPSVAFWGARVSVLNMDKCTISMRKNFRNKNPFRSVYFGALAGAAELSTGLLCQLHLRALGDCSMLVVKMNGSFYKKATGILTFVCEDGQVLSQKLPSLSQVGDTTECIMKSIVFNEKNDIIAEFHFTWSFKKRN